MSDNLPQILSNAGEVVRVLEATDLLHAAGLAGRLDDATIAELGEFGENVEHLTKVGKEARGLVSDALVARLDRKAKWTLREGGFEVKAPSPEAGPVQYDEQALRVALTTLVEERLIDQEGADAALEPTLGTVPITLEELDLLDQALAADVDDDSVYSVALELVEVKRKRIPATTYTPRANGIKALRKVGGKVAAAIDDCELVDQPIPDRKATIKRKAGE